MSEIEHMESTAKWKARSQDLHAALDDLLNWAEHREGKGRMRRTEALERAREALHTGPESDA